MVKNVHMVMWCVKIHFYLVLGISSVFYIIMKIVFGIDPRSNSDSPPQFHSALMNDSS